MTDEFDLVIDLTVHGSTRTVMIQAIVDTGFNDFLTLPEQLIDDLGLPWLSRSPATLADGSEGWFDVYSGSVSWDGDEIAIPIACAGSDPLVGMRLLAGFSLYVDSVADGAIRIEPLASVM